jgi:hypothetical protein
MLSGYHRIGSNLTLYKFFSISYQVLLNIQVFWHVTVCHWASSSWGGSFSLPGLLDHDGDSTACVPNIWNCSPNDTASHPKWLETEQCCCENLKSHKCLSSLESNPTAFVTKEEKTFVSSWQFRVSWKLIISCHLSCVLACSRYVYRVTVVGPEIHKFLLLYIHTTATAT